MLNDLGMMILYCFVYATIAFRIVPTILQWRTMSKANLGSTYFFLLSLSSFLADVMGALFTYLKIHTDIIFNLYQISEVVFITMIAIEIGRFKKLSKRIIYFFCYCIAIAILIKTFQVNFDGPLNSLFFFSKAYAMIVCLFASVNFVRVIDMNTSYNPAPLIGLFGVFFFVALSLIFLFSLEAQRSLENYRIINIIYVIFLCIANLVRDSLITLNALLNKKRNTNES